MTADANIDKAVSIHLLGLVDVLEIDDDWARYQIAQALEIESSELLSFSRNHQSIGSFSA